MAGWGYFGGERISHRQKIQAAAAILIGGRALTEGWELRGLLLSTLAVTFGGEGSHLSEDGNKESTAIGGGGHVRRRNTHRKMGIMILLLSAAAFMFGGSTAHSLENENKESAAAIMFASSEALTRRWEGKNQRWLSCWAA